MTDIAATLSTLKAAPPLVHCITNYVAMNVAANALLAAGASPAMIHTEEEAGEFAAVASALTVNMGTISPHWIRGMRAAISGARGAGRPWVLDPVAHFATSYRREVVAELMSMLPTVIRGNASEILALAGGDSAGRGVDAGDSVAVAEDGARRLAADTGAVVAVTGEIDFVTDGTRAARLRGGSALMPKVTAMGCALTAVTGACVAAAGDGFDGTIAALALFKEAGAVAEPRSEGPGSFAVAFIDALAAVDPSALASRVEAA